MLPHALDCAASPYDSNILALTAFVILFTHWSLQELLERKYGMKPRVTTVSELKRLAAKTNHPEDAFEINMRSSILSISFTHVVGTSPDSRSDSIFVFCILFVRSCSCTC